LSLYTLDANVISVILRGNREVSARMATALTEEHQISLNALSYFEVKRGLYLPRFRRKLDAFMEFVADYGVLPLDLPALDIAADIYQDLRSKGTSLEDADILMAGIALANDAILVTRNIRHFERIRGLKLENWEERNEMSH
jgi:tRNA(fMet)-specific endonuclease VapC